MQRLSRIIGIGAVKYYDLKQCRTTDYAFSYDKMLDLTGNTAIFLLYQYARICSIKRKANVSDEELSNFTDISINTPQEKKLAMCAFRFESVLLKTAEDLFPHYLTDFAYELMSCFSDFFQNCKVIDDPLQNSRLCLVEVTRITLKKTLELLNIETAERI
uniref:arginine--tRNA ligase n=1 Tax=Lygus hesperus TaxID=30085 RepID=A0A0A9X8M3_LYGHE